MKSFTLFLLTGLYPIVTHAAIMLHESRIALVYLVALIMVYVTHNLWKTHRILNMLLLAGLAGMLFVFLDFKTVALIYLPPVCISFFIFTLFASGLLPGHVPVITLIAKKMHVGELSPELLQYTRKCTIFWSAFTAIIFIETIILGIFASPAIWSLFCNILNYLFIGLAMVLEYCYRIFRYGKLIGTRAYIRQLFRINWYKLPGSES